MAKYKYGGDEDSTPKAKAEFYAADVKKLLTLAEDTSEKRLEYFLGKVKSNAKLAFHFASLVDA